MEITKSSSNHEILDSGSIILFDGDAELELSIKMDDSFQFGVILRFESTNDGKQNLTSDVNDNKITLSCINFNNILGTGTRQPIELAQFQGKRVYMHFWVYALGDTSLRRIAYTFYMER